MQKKKEFSPITISNFTQLFLALLIVILLVACGKKKVEEDIEYSTGRVYETDKNVLIPVHLVKVIRKLFTDQYKVTSEVEGLSDKEIVKKIVRRYLNISIYISSHLNNMTSKNVKFDLPSGGGYIDLSEVIREGVRGNFSLKFEVQEVGEPPVKIDDKIKVFFVSNAKKRDIGGRVFGAGCNKFLDLTQAFRKWFTTEGLVVNSTGQRFLSILGGTFFFVYPLGESLYLGSLTFKDSRYPEHLCRS